MCIKDGVPKYKQKPVKMVGKFWHCCVADGQPVYMGDVTYERDIEQ